MNLEEMIRTSCWWERAWGMPDRHHSPESGVTLADHLERVTANLGFLEFSDEGRGYHSELRSVLIEQGFDPKALLHILRPVTLLHDIGKLLEQEGREDRNFPEKKVEKRRHQELSFMIADELIPEGYPGRETILSMIAEHGQPHSWYGQFKKSGQVPKRKSWARLDRKINIRQDGTGLILLCLFKIADIDGHEDLEDVRWFIGQSNISYLEEKGRWLPVPGSEDIVNCSDV